MKRYLKLTTTLSMLTLSGGLFLGQVHAAESLPGFSYDDAAGTGPSFWGDLHPSYHQCKDGFEQSPIDISNTVEKEIGELKFKYRKTPLTILNNGHTLQVNYADGSKLKINGQEYKLLQFHFHTPSEHTVNGQATLMEAHFVHVNNAGQLAVVGVLLEEGRKNKLLEKILHHAPEEGQTVTIDENVSGLALMPEREDEAEDFYNYAGSLTTPPCSEGVRWFVLKKTMTVSHEQAEEFSHFVHGINARPVQAINDRSIFANDD